MTAKKNDFRDIKNDVSVSMVHCVNTGCTYIYEIMNGEIINEQKVHE